MSEEAATVFPITRNIGGGFSSDIESRRRLSNSRRRNKTYNRRCRHSAKLDEGGAASRAISNLEQSICRLRSGSQNDANSLVSLAANRRIKLTTNRKLQQASDASALEKQSTGEPSLAPYSEQRSSIVEDLNEVDLEGFTVRKQAEASSDKSAKWSSSGSSGLTQAKKQFMYAIGIITDDETDVEFQTSKIKSLQIRPLNESKTQIHSSIEEIKTALGHMSLGRNSVHDIKARLLLKYLDDRH